MTILVFGSLNIDLVTRTPRLPMAGETLTGRSLTAVPGGKGGNQAVACARLGAPTHMIGRVGGDQFGQQLLDSLTASGINTESVLIDNETSSGVAAIAVDDTGENNIIVVPGANGRVNEQNLERLATLLPQAELLLLQLEVPLPMVTAAAQLAHEQGVQVILDPAPAVPLPDELYPAIDILTPNETETVVLTGLTLDNDEAIEQAAAQLLEKGVRQIVIKLGGRGIYAAGAEANGFYPAVMVEVVDTVAAGDAFNGGLAVALHGGMPFTAALQWGLASGAYAVTQSGAQTAMPTRSQLKTVLNSR